jgi:hypothetical protein
MSINILFLRTLNHSLFNVLQGKEYAWPRLGYDYIKYLYFTGHLRKVIPQLSIRQLVSSMAFNYEWAPGYARKLPRRQVL